MRLIKNKYVITILIFFVWMLFFDQNNFGNRFKLTSNLNNLKKQKEYYLSEIEQNQSMTHRLNHDTAFIEQFAREKYLLKRDNEVIYVIVRE
jgi:cell division protein DivIC